MFRRLMKLRPADTMTSLYLMQCRAGGEGETKNSSITCSSCTEVKKHQGLKPRAHNDSLEQHTGKSPPPLPAFRLPPLSPVHDRQQLLPHILRTPQAPRLHKVLEAPRSAEVLGLPRLVHCQQRQVVALRLKELGLLLICLRLLLARAVENILCLQQQQQHRKGKQVAKQHL